MKHNHSTMKRLIFIALILVLGENVKSAKILMVAPMPTHAHFVGAFRLGKELADRGHEVTAVTPYPQYLPIENYRDVSVAENIHIMEEEKKTHGRGRRRMTENLLSLFRTTSQITRYTLANPNVRNLMTSGERFDVIIIEHFLNEALVGLGHHFQAPVILLSPGTPSVINNYIFANPAPSSYVPNRVSTLSKHMTFWQRFQNFVITSISSLLIQFHHLPTQCEIFNSYVSDVELDHVLYNVSLMLANSHASVSDAVPLVPGIKEIGGYHVMPPQKLPDDLQEYLDAATEGAVLFSMGATWKSKDFKPRMIDAVLGAFAKIKQKVVWKFEGDLHGLPDNVRIMKWVPQQDILAHPNTRAFITSGGFLSCVEAVYFGVPLVGVPALGEQKYNVEAAVSNGYAVSVGVSELTEEKLSGALDEILNNPEYRENARRRSELMHDQPLKAIDAAVYWVEHVIRHRGAPHFRSAGLDLKWYQREMMDIFLFFFVLAAAVSWGVCKVGRKMRAWRSSKTKVSINKKRK